MRGKNLSGKIVSVKPITLAEAKRMLEEREESLDPLQMRTLEYSRRFGKLDLEQAAKLLKSLMEQYELTVEEAVQIVDVCPETVDELRTILSGYRRMVSFLLFSEDKMKGIVELVRKALKASKG